MTVMLGRLGDHQDAWGHEMLDWFKRRPAAEIIERDDGYVEAFSPQGYFNDYDDWSPRERRAIRLVRRKTLDIGCGAGKHSLYLQRRRFDVLGIDISPLAIKVCRMRGLVKTRVMSIAEVDPELGAFDTVLMLGTNFGLFGNFRNARVLLRKLRNVTTAKARIIAETRDPYDTNDQFHLRYHKFNLKRGRMPGEVRMRVRYKWYRTPWFDRLFVSRREMKELVREAGWRIERFIDEKGPEFIAIIVKE
jgi:SAM-dependent methyltransferase